MGRGDAEGSRHLQAPNIVSGGPQESRRASTRMGRGDVSELEWDGAMPRGTRMGRGDAGGLDWAWSMPVDQNVLGQYRWTRMCRGICKRRKTNCIDTRAATMTVPWRLGNGEVTYARTARQSGRSRGVVLLIRQRCPPLLSD